MLSRLRRWSAWWLGGYGSFEEYQRLHRSPAPPSVFERERQALQEWEHRFMAALRSDPPW